MQKVITINLNGNAYQLDESAYNALRAYLSLAEVQLANNPDRAEILADFEQAIADKCRRFLGPAKTVITAAEMDQIVNEMGPVEGAATAPPPAADAQSTINDAPAGTPPPPYKRLYRIPEGAMFAGVCTGLAAYFNIDINIVRILFVLTTVLSGGIGWLVYVSMMFIVPEAETSEERAAAHGQPPFNAQDIIDQAKKTAADFTGTFSANSREWGRQFRAQQRLWRRQWGSWSGAPPAGYPPRPPRAGFLMPVFGLISLMMVILFAAAITSLIKSGTLWGLNLPGEAPEDALRGVPVWVGILVIVIGFQILTAPLRAARHASYYWGGSYGWFAMWNGLIATMVTLLVVGLLYTYMPPTHDFREFMQNLPEAIRSLGQDIRMWFEALVGSFREDTVSV